MAAPGFFAPPDGSPDIFSRQRMIGPPEAEQLFERFVARRVEFSFGEAMEVREFVLEGRRGAIGLRWLIHAIQPSTFRAN